LAWKLSMVMDGHARTELLDTYTSERVPVGEALLESTKKATQMIELRSRFTNLALPVIFGVVSRVTPIRKRMQREMLGGMSGLLLSCSEGELTSPSDYKGPGPAPGDRVTWVDESDMRSQGWPTLLEAFSERRWTLLTSVPPGDRAADSAIRW